MSMPEIAKPDLPRYLRISILGTLCLFISLGAVLLMGWKRIGWDTPLFTTGHFIVAVLFFALAAAFFFWDSATPEWDLFAPKRLFYTGWFVLLGLGSLRLTTVEQPLSVRFWVATVLGLSGFGIGCALASHRGAAPLWPLSALKDHWTVDWVPKRAVPLLAGIFGVAVIALAYEYLKAGAFPLLSDDPEWARFNFAVNSYVHRFVLTLYLLVVLGYVGYSYLGKHRVLFAVIVAVSALSMILLSARALLLSAIWMVVVLFHYGRRRVTLPGVLAAVLILYPVGKLAIDLKRFYENEAFNSILDRIEFPQRLRSIAPDYIYFSFSLQTLDHLTHIVPEEVPYSAGWYTFYPVRVFWTPREGEGFRGRLDDMFWDRSSDWSPITSVTTTYMGVPYADFGMLGVLLFSVGFGWVATKTYLNMRHAPTFWRVFLYSEISFALVLSIYSNYLTLFDVYWNLAVVGCVHWLSARRRRHDLPSGLLYPAVRI